MRQQTDPKQIARLVLKRYGTTYAEDLHIDVRSNTPSALFALLIAALLASARISSAAALRAAGKLRARGWTSPRKLAAATWEQRVKALDESGYVRYDERTSTMLGETAQMVDELYRGDLRKLREAAGRDPQAERKLLKQFKGIGDVGVDIFFREVQLAWDELAPFADRKAAESARKLGLPTDPAKLAALVRGRREYVRLLAALVKASLDHKQDEIREEARRAA
jgi:endonuclease III